MHGLWFVCRTSQSSLASSQLQLQLSTISSCVKPASHHEPLDKPEAPGKVTHFAFASYPRNGTSPGNISARSKSSPNDSCQSATVTPRNADKSTLSLNQLPSKPVEAQLPEDNTPEGMDYTSNPESDLRSNQTTHSVVSFGYEQKVASQRQRIFRNVTPQDVGPFR